MAIVIEEEKDRSNILVFIGWVVVVTTILVAVYFIFFQNPEIIETVGPEGFRRTKEVSQININTEEILRTGSFPRPSYVTEPGEGVSGRTNPFLPL